MNMSDYRDKDIWIKYEKTLNEMKKEKGNPMPTNIAPKPTEIKNKDQKKIQDKKFDIDVEDLLIQVALDGIIFDENEARESMCRCAETPKETLYCFKKGIIGALSQPQIKEYCPPEKMETSKFAKISKEVANKISEINNQCTVDHVKDLNERFKCIFNLAKQDNLI